MGGWTGSGGSKCFPGISGNIMRADEPPDRVEPEPSGSWLIPYDRDRWAVISLENGQLVDIQAFPDHAQAAAYLDDFVRMSGKTLAYFEGRRLLLSPLYPE